MLVPFSVADFIDRAVQVYGDRVGVVDEPDQPAPTLGDLTYAQVGDLASRQAAHLDSLGADVIAGYPGASFGEGDGERQPDMTAASDDHNITAETTAQSGSLLSCHEGPPGFVLAFCRRSWQPHSRLQWQAVPQTLVTSGSW